MSHPNETDLALFAGGELDLWARWRIGRHVAGCDQCGHEVRRFRSGMGWIGEVCHEQPPELEWHRLSAEMKANIQVGLAAGRCVGPVDEPPKWAGWRMATALASIVFVAAAGWLLQPREPRSSVALPQQGIVLEATATGIELKQEDAVLSLQHPDAERVTLLMSTHGSLRANYVDSETGYVTINNVYAQ